MTLTQKRIICIAIGVAATALILVFGLRDTRPVVVCFGDSLTSCGGKGGHYSDWLAKQLPHFRIIDAGVGGDTLEQGRHRFQKDVLRHRPTVVLIALGANDFWKATRTVGELQRYLEEMVKAAQAQKAQVVIASCFGDRQFWDETCVEFAFARFELAAKIAKMEQSVCDKYGCVYVPNMQVDVKPNRLPPYWDATDHPNKVGNEQVALRLLPAIIKATERR
ncbi:MAG: SGNH/GDSL hydrolase family protein [Kiritimatiellaeota bacterium]|nr:SGNH/GDSL hydrolase family protein [Kiritimatiellota bacterium]